MMSKTAVKNDELAQPTPCPCRYVSDLSIYK